MIKKIFIILLASLTLFSLTPVQAATSESKGKISKKDEVIYTNLNADGSENEMYIVNALHVKKAGEITDYGAYTNLKNLTSLNEIKQSDNKNVIEADKGKFYYQGEVDNKSLPWAFDIIYKLDGKKIEPQALIGQSGQLEIQIETKHDKDIDQTFFENYLLQFSLTFDGEKTENIKTKDGTLANNGKKELVNFTVMPKEDAKLTVTADVEDFEMEGIQISAIPANMAVDLPDTDDMIKDMETLVDAIQSLDEGVGELKDGALELKNGTSELAEGSEQYAAGLKELDGSSGQLLDGSAEIKSALQQIKASLDNFDVNEIDFDALENMQALEADFNEAIEIIEAMDLSAGSIKDLLEDAYSDIDAVTAELKAGQLTDEDIQALKESDLDPALIERIIGLSEGTQDAIEVFEANRPSLSDVTDEIDKYQKPIEETLNDIKQMMQTVENINIEEELKSLLAMVEGLQQLSTEYNQFHQGLTDYTSGVGQLNKEYGQLNNGINSLDDGFGEFVSGVDELKDGSGELADKTSRLPKEMTDEIDEMMAEFDMSDFDPVSFISKKNKKIDVVQFVIQTEDIKADKEKEAGQEKAEELSFWEKILNLFKKSK